MRLHASRSAPYLFLTPFIMSFLIFGAYPILRSLVLSLYITSGPEAQRFVGLDNYLFLLKDPDFWTAFRNTATFALGSVALQLPIRETAGQLAPVSTVKATVTPELAWVQPLAAESSAKVITRQK